MPNLIDFLNRIFLHAISFRIFIISKNKYPLIHKNRQIDKLFNSLPETYAKLIHQQIREYIEPQSYFLSW